MYSKLYRGIYLNAEADPTTNEPDQQEVRVDIWDTESGESDTPEIIELELAEIPTETEVVNNDEDKFDNPIRSKRCNIRLHSSDTISIDTFSEGSDLRFYVEKYINDVCKFKGWLSTSDLEQDFLPDPTEISLIATDGLGFLSEEDLTDFDGITPQNENTLLEYLQWCLSKTGLNLPLWAAFNIREESASPIADTLTQIAIFSSTPENQFVTSPTSFFTVGGTYTISGTASNNITFTVSAVGSGAVTIVQATGDPFTTEADVVATFTKSASTIGLGHMFSHCSIDAKTFEKNIGDCEDCATVINKILGETAVLFQYNGVWVILRIDEMEAANPLRIFKWDENGDFIETVELDVDKSAGDGQPLSWMDDDQKRISERAIKILNHDFRYEYPEEIVCNIDFDRGDVISAPDNSLAEATGTYEIECWNLLRFSLSPPYYDVSPESGASAIITREFKYGYEKNKYASIENAGGQTHYIRSTNVDVLEGDKMQIGISIKWDDDVDYTNQIVMNLMFTRSDGTIYELDYNESDGRNSWRTRDPLAPDEMQYFVELNTELIDVTEYQSMNIDVPAIPSDDTAAQAIGFITIRIINSLNGTSVPLSKMYFRDFSMEITPFINGSYSKYTTQRHSVSQENKTKAKREKQIYIDNAPHPAMKGALKVLNSSGAYVLAGFFYDAARHTAGPTSQSQLQQYGFIRAFDVWNQYNRTMRKFEGNIDHLESGGEMPDLIHKYSLTDPSPSTTGKKFILLHYLQDDKNCSMGVFLHEVYDENNPKVYTGYIFKYLTQADV